MALLNLNLFLIFSLMQCCITFYRCNAQDLSNIPALFVFGDSAVDTGNNNYLPTTFKADYKPYGINFPGGVPTGRFSDGKLIPDMVASLLGLGETVPPFLQPNLSDDELLKGACFASAAAGLDNQTLAFTGQINMLKQPEYLAAYIERLTAIAGEDEARRIVSEALVIINAGTVDLLYNYYLFPSSRVLQYSVTEYQNLLLSNLQILIKILYELGCRKMIISALPPIGCVPVVITRNSPLRRTCLENFNSDAQIYNEKLVKLLSRLQAKLQGSKLIRADTYTPLMDLIKNPQKHGFVETSRGCCGTGLIEFGQFCNPLTPVCKNPQEYVFWDAVHPTESAYDYVNDYILMQAASELNIN